MSSEIVQAQPEAQRQTGRLTIGMRMMRLITAVASYIFLSIFAIVVGYPLVWMVFQSLKSTPEMYRNVWGLPSTPLFQNYVNAWNLSQIGRYSFNSLFVACATVLLVLVVSTLAGYAFARMRFRGSTIIFIAIVFSLLIPTPIIPLYAVVSALKLTDTYWALILPYATGGLPLSIFLLKAFFEGIPQNILDAARIDGCSDFATLWRIVLPLAKPGLATVAIFQFIGAWNEYFLALIFIRSQAIRTIPIGLQVFFYENSTKWPELFATLAMATIPILIVYILMQQQFIEGLTAGAVKG